MSNFGLETREFLLDLRENNTREWFAANRERYEAHVKAPALAWVAALGARLQTLDADLAVDLRTNGGGNLMRAARDTRFSKDKSPYKVNVAMLWWRGGGKKMQMPCFGMQLTPDDAGLMCGMFHFPKPMLEAFRQAVCDETLGAALDEAALRVTADGYAIQGQHYKTAPRGYDRGHPRIKWLRHNALYASSPTLAWDAVAAHDFLEVCFGHFERMAAVYHWLARAQDQFGGL